MSLSGRPGEYFPGASAKQLRSPSMEQRYRFIRLLGEGAMGEVYLAEHTALGRREAVKILRPQLAEDPEFVAGFRREARATNRVQHPNIVGVYDFGKLTDGRLYLAMEYAEGIGLDTLLERSAPLPVARVLPILAQLAHAVGHAHGHGVVHRDLKPGNLILTEHRGQSDFLKVLDFGMAKILAPEIGDGLPLTLTGAIMGTPTYMAPEHILGRAVDGRADVYAIGCIAYEMLSGKPPFTGARMEIADAHVSRRPIPLAAKLKDIPAAVDLLVQRCLEKSPDKRTGSANELKAELDRIIGLRGKRPTSGSYRPVLPPKNDFETADTGVGAEAMRRAEAPTTERQLRPLGYVAGDPAYADDPAEDEEYDHSRIMLLRAAERLLDRDRASPELICAVVDVKDAEQDRTKLTQELAEVERHLDAVEQDAREREAALRFALGDLEFERTQRGLDRDKTAVDVGPRILSLNEKLERITHRRERDIGKLTEQSVALTAQLANLEDQLQILYRRLDDAVNQTVGAR